MSEACGPESSVSVTREPSRSACTWARVDQTNQPPANATQARARVVITSAVARNFTPSSSASEVPGFGACRAGKVEEIYLLDVVPEHQFLRMRCEIHLPVQICNFQAANVVPDQRDRDDERDPAEAIVVDELEQLIA